VGNYIAKVVRQMKEFYLNLTPMKRISVIAAGVIIVVATLIMAIVVSGRGYQTLFTDIPAEQATVIMQKLRDKNIPFQLQDGGKIITVPPEYVSMAQMMIMQETGFAKVGNLGLELFDKESFGTTSYAQRINFQRALQGEHMRAINSLDSVKTSKVLLSLPPKKTFLEEGDRPSASVVVDLKDGKVLSQDQVKGIIHLVSNAVEGLEPERVTVLDARGKMLSKNLVGGLAGMSNEMLEVKNKREQEFEQRIEDILSKVVGTGRVIARVNADLNFKQVSSTEELVDPDHSAIKSQQTEEEKLRGSRTNNVGAPGARANLPGAEDVAKTGFSQDVDKELKTINNENSKTIRNIKEPIGGVDRMSVAVLVDGVMETTTGDDGKPVETWRPRTAEELAKYESIIKNAIGFDEKRGDSVKVDTMQFQKENFDEAEKILNTLEKRRLFKFLVYWSVVGIGFILFFFILVRPFMRFVTESFQESVDEMLPKTIEELENLQRVDNTLPGMAGALPMLEETLDPDKAESELLKERILNLITADGKKAAHALGQWVEDRRIGG